RAMPVDEAEAAGEIPVEHQVLAHEADRFERDRVELARSADRHPVAAQQVAHRRARADAGKELVFLRREQGASCVLRGSNWIMATRHRIATRYLAPQEVACGTSNGAL